MTGRHTVMAATCALLAQTVLSFGAQAPRLTAQLNRQQIYLGESAVLTVKASGIKDPPRPDLTGIRDADIKFLGSRGNNRKTVTIINGRVNRQESIGRIFSYEITPRAPGRLTVGPIKLSVAGGLSQSGPPLSVVGVDKQDNVLLEVASSRDELLVDEPFEITISTLLKQLPPPYSDHHPLDYNHAPMLGIPFLEGAPVQGLDVPDLTPLLQKLLVRRSRDPGFGINDLKLRDSWMGLPSMSESRKARFMFKHDAVTHDGQAYHRYQITLSYLPREEGDYTFGPVTLKGPIIVGVGAGGHATTAPIFAVGAATTVRVVPPPEENRPESYVGIIASNLSVVASLDTDTCKLGDPLSLTLRITGVTNERSLSPPDLADNEALTRHFRVYDDRVKVDSDESSRSYTYILRPTTAGTIEIPPIPISFFDNHSRTYRTVTSQPLPLQVAAAAQVDSNTLIDTVTNRLTSSSSRHERQRVPAPAWVSPLPPAPARWRPSSMQWACIVLAPCFWLCTVFLPSLKRRGARQKELRRARQALPLALSALRRLKRARGDAQARQTERVIRTYLSSRFDVPAETLTPPELDRALAPHLPEESRKPLIHLLASLFNASYGGAAEGHAETIKRVQAALTHADGTLRKRKNRRQGGAILLLVLLAGVLTPSSGQALSDDEQSFLWTEAMSRLANAHTKADFAAAAGPLREVATRGGGSGQVFYDLGTALLLADQPGEARKALLRSERHMGSTPEIRRNLRLASTEGDALEPSLPWTRVLLFWHYRLSFSARLWLALSGWVLLWCGWGLRRLVAGRGGGLMVGLGVVLLILYGGSVLVSVAEEQRDIRAASYTSASLDRQERETP